MRGRPAGAFRDFDVAAMVNADLIELPDAIDTMGRSVAQVAELVRARLGPTA